MSERKLKAWRDAGLLNDEIVNEIREWEAAHRRPWGLWAMIGLGALAIGLGILSVVAANWDAIPGVYRLAFHLALLTALSAFLWRYAADNDLFQDGMLFVAAVLGLTFFAHVGQVYQTSSPLWQPLLAWIIIYSPLLLMFGRGWPIAGLWIAGVLGTAWSHAEEAGHLLSWYAGPPRLSYPTLYWGLIACPPMLVAAGAAFMRARSSRARFWSLLEKQALAVILFGLTLIIIAGGLGSRPMMGSVIIQSFALICAAVAIFTARNERSGHAAAGVLAIAAILHFVYALLLEQVGRAGGPWIGALFFAALWGAVAIGALHARSRSAFQLAVALLALRIIILSFELNDDLLGSGVGLIVSGAFAMLVAWGTVRIARRYAPEGEAA